MEMIEMMIGTWSGEEDEGGVVFSEDFLEAPRVVQLDFLIDMIHELNGYYEKMLETKDAIR
jgi:membrane glycosyltransferase